jgi:hypothetical protein
MDRYVPGGPVQEILARRLPLATKDHSDEAESQLSADIRSFCSFSSQSTHDPFHHSTPQTFNCAASSVTRADRNVVRFCEFATRKPPVHCLSARRRHAPPSWRGQWPLGATASASTLTTGCHDTFSGDIPTDGARTRRAPHGQNPRGGGRFSRADGMLAPC